MNRYATNLSAKPPALAGFFLLLNLIAPAPAAEVEYMPQVWRNRGADINVIAQPGSENVLVIDNAGQPLFEMKEYSQYGHHQVVGCYEGQTYILRGEGYRWSLALLDKSGKETSTIPNPGLRGPIIIRPQQRVVISKGDSHTAGMRSGLFAFQSLKDGQEIPLTTGLKFQAGRQKNHDFELMIDNHGKGFWMVDHTPDGKAYKAVRADFAGETTHELTLGDSRHVLDAGPLLKGKAYFLVAENDVATGGVKEVRQLVSFDPASKKTLRSQCNVYYGNAIKSFELPRGDAVTLSGSLEER